ncbi:putative voltage-gated potassium channel subunit beta [Vitis vinifera]|uniref:Putative voltage-gated potassium channel subunit beta n=1 Tax=Vitis vinifera TaxID=29760 RepID=A0A438CME2_VITVI|nr:putative voltage-gated potassium channel subunit beta [Vitis vinifera]
MAKNWNFEEHVSACNCTSITLLAIIVLQLFSQQLSNLTSGMQIQENMKAIDVIPLLTPTVLEKIEAVVQSKPKRPDSYR